MSFYLNIPFLGCYCDVDVEYDIIDGDDSVGLPVDYEITVTYTDDFEDEIDITEQLTRAEYLEVIDAIQKDLKDWEYKNAID